MRDTKLRNFAAKSGTMFDMLHCLNSVYTDQEISAGNIHPKHFIECNQTNSRF